MMIDYMFHAVVYVLVAYIISLVFRAHIRSVCLRACGDKEPDHDGEVKVRVFGERCWYSPEKERFGTGGPPIGYVTGILLVVVLWPIGVPAALGLYATYLVATKLWQVFSTFDRAVMNSLVQAKKPRASETL